jgi:light-regulated signal transduction histidine kinase (bacteriophytochrome)
MSDISTIFKTCNVFRRLTKIQSRGYLIMITHDTYNIVGFSDNIINLIKLNETNILNIIHKDYHELFKNCINKLDEYSIKNSIMKINNEEFYFHIYKTNIYIILEFEKKYDNSLDTFEDLIDISYNICNNSINYDYLLNNISKLIDYDRIMLYKFNNDWSGVVVSEIINDNSCSLLNQYFADTDIPQYVRGLFMKNNSRYIEDIDDIGINVQIKENPIFDITMSQLHIISESHYHYLKELNVKSAFSCAIIINNTLWGLLICHNHTKKVISPLIRSYCLKLIELYTNNVFIQQKKEKEIFNQYIFNLHNISYNYNNINKHDLQQKYKHIIIALCQSLKADCVISNIENVFEYDIVSKHISIPHSEINTIWDIIKVKLINKKQYITNNIDNDILNQNSETSFFHSLIYLKIKNDTSIVFLKVKIIQDVIYAGNPNNYVIKDNIVYSRYDFSEFKCKKNVALDWNINDENLFNIYKLLQNIINRILDYDHIHDIVEYDNDEQRRNIGIMNLIHDIKTPLNSLDGLYMLLNDLFDRNDQHSLYAKELLKDGNKIVQDLRDITTNVIEFIKNKYGYYNIIYTEINIYELINNIYDIYKYSIKSNISFNKHIDENIPKYLIGDSIKLKRIIGNLLSNASKYTYNGNISIQVNLLDINKYICWIEFIVSDTGIGFTHDQQLLVFKEFSQFNKNEDYSSGIGLSMCYKLVHMLNGYITLTSNENQGSKFIFKLPLRVPS